MQIIHSPQEWQTIRQNFKPEQSLGFVPTMGNLHKGHMSLVNKSKHEQTLTAVSLFVNPTQFNQAEDFNCYPRTLKADCQMLRDAGVDYCFVPEPKALYADDYRFQVHETLSSLILEGAHRPGHFTGMLTIVLKLLSLMQARRAYLGEKDYQQYELIRDMASAFFLTTEIVPCPTIREDSGLAFSSRNGRLNGEERQQADAFARIFHQYDKSCAEIKQELEALGFVLDYLEDHNQRRYVALHLGAVRLIDNRAI